MDAGYQIENLRDSELHNFSQLSLPELDPSVEIGTDVWIMTPTSADYAISSDETLLVGLDPKELTEFKPTTQRGPPLKINFPGEVNFRVEVNGADANKKKFLYSYKLNRIYVDVNCNFSLSFNWNLSAPTEMFVRSTVVFSETEQSEKRVERCVQHFHECSGTQPKVMAKNVMHSSRDIGTDGVYYCGDTDVPDSWFSVVVRYFKTNPEPCTHAYKFNCKSSCASGINRRPIDIIFTLEDRNGRVYGRQTVGVKVCACLRRDMQKDEEAEGVFKAGKKRIASNQIAQNRTKKVKVEMRDTELNMAVLPQISVEANAMASGIRTMIDAMSIAIQHNPDVSDKYTPSIDELKKFLNNLEKDTTPTE